MTDVGRRSNSAVTCPHGLLYAWVTGTSVPQSQLQEGSYLFYLMCPQSLNHVRLFVTLWTIARQAPLSVGFSRQEYWSGLSFPPPGELSNPGSLALAGRFFTTEPPGKPILFLTNKQNQLKENLQTRLRRRSSESPSRCSPVPRPWVCSQLPWVQAPLVSEGRRSSAWRPLGCLRFSGPWYQLLQAHTSRPHQGSWEHRELRAPPCTAPPLPSLDTDPQEVGQLSLSQALGHRGHPLSQLCGLPKYYQGA